MSFFTRAILFCLGLLLAIPAGLIALTVGVAVEPAARDLVAELGIAGADAFLRDLWEDGHADVEVAGAFFRLWVLSSALLVMPPIFVALVGEIAGIRSFIWYGFGTGALTAIIPWISRGESVDAIPGAEARLTMLLFLAGAAAGLTYWLVAGRSAGFKE